MTAVITGASSGIGAAFANRLAAEGHDLVLVARDGARLTELASGLSDAHQVSTQVIAADLATDEGCATLIRQLADLQVDVLINNAGIGLDLPFPQNGIEAEERLLLLNVRAVLRLTHAVLPEMLQRGQGSIVNVSSVAGFGPAWLLSSYPASKAWVTTFTESLAYPVRRKGLRMMAFCPGYTRTEFHERAGMSTDHISRWLWQDADAVVRCALRDLRRGKVVSIPGIRYRVLAAGLRHLPRQLSIPFCWQPAPIVDDPVH